MTSSHLIALYNDVEDVIRELKRYGNSSQSIIYSLQDAQAYLDDLIDEEQTEENE